MSGLVHLLSIAALFALGVRSDGNRRVAFFGISQRTFHVRSAGARWHAHASQVLSVVAKRRLAWVLWTLRLFGHLLVNLENSFEKTHLGNLTLSDVINLLLQNIWSWNIEENKKGVLPRPWTKWMVSIVISITLKFQSAVKCWKLDFLMSSKIVIQNRLKFVSMTVRSVQPPWKLPNPLPQQKT